MDYLDEFSAITKILIGGEKRSKSEKGDVMMEVEGDDTL